MSEITPPPAPDIDSTPAAMLAPAPAPVPAGDAEVASAESAAADATVAPLESAEPAEPAEPAGPTEPADAAVAPAAAPAAASLSPADAAQQLKQLFPALFAGAAKPLKLRIQVDIQERAPGRFSKQALSAFFRRHTGSTSYLIAVTKAAHRYDLDGQPAGEITAEHRQVAQDELARRRDSQQSRRDLEEQQRRNRAGLLHDFQTTTLTKANFCALKGVPVDDLDGLLEIARGEAEERARQAPPARPNGSGNFHQDRERRPNGTSGPSGPGAPGGPGGSRGAGGPRGSGELNRPSGPGGNPRHGPRGPRGSGEGGGRGGSGSPGGAPRRPR